MFLHNKFYARFVFFYVFMLVAGHLLAVGNLDIKWMRFYNAYASQREDDVLTATLELLYPNDEIKQKNYAPYLEDRSSSESIKWAEKQVAIKGLAEKDKVVPALVLLMDPATTSSLTTPSLTLPDIFPNHRLSGQLSYSQIAHALIIGNSEEGKKVRSGFEKHYPVNDYPSTYSLMAQTYQVPESQIEEVKASLKANLYGKRYSAEDRKTLQLRLYSYFNTVDDRELLDEMISLLEKSDSGKVSHHQQFPLFNSVMRIGTLNGGDYFEPVFRYIQSQCFASPEQDDSLYQSNYQLETSYMMTFLQIHSEKGEVARFLFDRLLYKEPGRFYRFLEHIAFTIRQNIRAKVPAYLNADRVLDLTTERYERMLSVIKDN